MNRSESVDQLRLLTKLIALLRYSIDREKIYPSRPELYRPLAAIEAAAQLLMKEMCDLIIYAYVVAEGRIFTEGLPAELTAKPEIRRAYLGL